MKNLKKRCTFILERIKQFPELSYYIWVTVKNTILVIRRKRNCIPGCHNKIWQDIQIKKMRMNTVIKVRGLIVHISKIQRKNIFKIFQIIQFMVFAYDFYFEGSELHICKENGKELVLRKENDYARATGEKEGEEDVPIIVFFDEGTTQEEVETF